jgi:lipopolysaccharide/colanic/teichoic acid biosynthesis glycosyltransferase
MLKRAFDATLAAAGLVASAPLWAVFAAAIKLEDGGPIFFMQDRVGLGGRTFDRSAAGDGARSPRHADRPLHARHRDG